MKPKITPKDFFLWLGAMAALYWSVIAFVFLIFNYIDYALPNALSYPSDPYQGGIPYEMASLVVLFPAYLGLMYLVRRDIARDPSRKEVWVRRWAIILTLFVAGVTIAADLIALLTAFFRGEELTVSFLLKTLLVFLVALFGFMHFAADLKGYWEANAKKLAAVVTAGILLVLVAIVSGFFIVGTPSSARLARLDAQKISDLESIQWQVVSYWQEKGKLPTGLSALNDSLTGFIAPTDPQSTASYEYKTTGARSFELCATFNKSGGLEGAYRGAPPKAAPAPGANDVSSSNWYHAAGRYCFERAIDPERYLPTKK